MTERDPDRPERPLSDLRHRIARIRERETARSGAPGRAGLSGGGMVLRVGIEMTGAIIVALAIGWGLDAWLGTRPWLMVVFLFLGGAAGVLNVYRAVAALGSAPGDRPPGAAGNASDGDADAGRNRSG